MVDNYEQVFFELKTPVFLFRNIYFNNFFLSLLMSTFRNMEKGW